MPSSEESTTGGATRHLPDQIRNRRTTDSDAKFNIIANKRFVITPPYPRIRRRRRNSTAVVFIVTVIFCRQPRPLVIR